MSNVYKVESYDMRKRPEAILFGEKYTKSKYVSNANLTI